MGRYWVTGPEVVQLVQTQVAAYRALAVEFGVMRP